jgi:hypothetical protein
MKIAVTATSFIKNKKLVSDLKTKLSLHEIKLADPKTELSGELLVEFLRDQQILIIGKEQNTPQI